MRFRGEIEPDLVASLKMLCVWGDWNPIVHFLADRYGLKGLPQPRTQVPRRHVDCLAGLVHVLEDRDEGGIRCGADGFELRRYRGHAPVAVYPRRGRTEDLSDSRAAG
jgi:hypothetical protein